MTNRQTSPGRKSKLKVVVVKPNGPHHCARCFGSVQAEKTGARGAANSRVPTIARGPCSRSTPPGAAISSVRRVWLGLALAAFADRHPSGRNSHQKSDDNG